METEAATLPVESVLALIKEELKDLMVDSVQALEKQPSGCTLLSEGSFPDLLVLKDPCKEDELLLSCCLPS